LGCVGNVAPLTKVRSKGIYDAIVLPTEHSCRGYSAISQFGDRKTAKTHYQLAVLPPFTRMICPVI
jgi:hypothetical protein